MDHIDKIFYDFFYLFEELQKFSGKNEQTSSFKQKWYNIHIYFETPMFA